MTGGGRIQHLRWMRDVYLRANVLIKAPEFRQLIQRARTHADALAPAADVLRIAIERARSAVTDYINHRRRSIIAPG